MPIKRFTATKDNTITDAYKENLSTSASLSNMGASDILEVFSIYAQATTSSLEKSRILIQFPVDEISKARSDGSIPAANSVDFKIKMSNATHSETLPKNFKLCINPLTREWSEGVGLDMESYSDADASNWISSSHAVPWSTPGSDYNNSLTYEKTAHFSGGYEDLNVDVTNIVEAWLAGTIPNYGLLLRLSGAFENGALERSYFTKRFFGHGSEFFFKKPVIEAQYESSIFDDRGCIFTSSSLSPAKDNLNSIYLYNKSRGILSDIPDTGSMLVVQLFSSSLGASAGATPETLAPAGGVNAASPTFITASRVSTGVYKAQFAYAGAKSSLFDIWSTSSSNIATTLLTGSGFSIRKNELGSFYENSEYVANVLNMKDSYSQSENITFRVYTRTKNWKPNIYTVASNSAPVNNVREGYYRISRVVDDHEIIPYSTGSISGKSFSRLSYDISGSFFDLDMSILESNYLYEMSFIFKDNDKFKEMKEKFRFRVD